MNDFPLDWQFEFENIAHSAKALVISTTSSDPSYHCVVNHFKHKFIYTILYNPSKSLSIYWCFFSYFIARSALSVVDKDIFPPFYD